MLSVDWNNGLCEIRASEDCRLFLECVQEGFLTQHARNKTAENSVLDLVLTKEPDLIDEVQNLGRFASRC